MRRAVFLDRDGVINEMVPSSDGPDSPRSASEFRLLPGAARAIHGLNTLGLPVVVVSNQPGIAKGKLDHDELTAITDVMRKKLSEEFAVLNGLYYCLHHPEAIRPEYRTSCECRKPKAGLLTKAEREMDISLEGSYMVGDHSKDMAAGKSVGCITFFVASTSAGQPPPAADYMCESLAGAARLIAELENASVAVH